jgi:integrase/recombinase XerC
MDSTLRSNLHCGRQLDERARPPGAEALRRYLAERGYAPHTAVGYVASAAHFLHWTERLGLAPKQIGESAIAAFLDEHIMHCDCGWGRREDRASASSALSHLLVVLRTIGMVPVRVVSTTPIDEEIRRFDEHLEHVRGLAPKTRQMMGRIVRELLWERFHDRPVVVTAITPEHLRRFFARLCERYRRPASVGSVVSALRGYFRYRAAAGDPVAALVSVLSYPANWQHASLPKSLADEEIERLLTSLDWPAPAMRRSSAIVRCAVDLGLRSGEIATLRLDDIDWRAGTVRLRKTKGRREHLLPLPEPTGRAIAAYLQHERPQSPHRAVFVRRVAPHDEPITAHLVRKTIRQAYRRAGLPYTRSHLLRHTMARRLLDAGSSLKEVADVLRHRSLNTTLIYAKLDSRNLSTVALPWPAVLPRDPPPPPPEVALSWPGGAS